MTLLMLRVEPHADTMRVEPLSQRIRLAACSLLQAENDDRKRRTAAA
ncbi:MAG: hypothetical protein V4472_17455 [Pseudomonadota bacterium]